MINGFIKKVFCASMLFLAGTVVAFAATPSEFPGLVLSKVTPGGANQAIAASGGVLPAQCPGITPATLRQIYQECGGPGVALVCVFNESHQGQWLTMGFSQSSFNAKLFNNPIGYLAPGASFAAAVCSTMFNQEFYMGGIAGHEFAFESSGENNINNNATVIHFAGDDGADMQLYKSEALPGYANASIAPNQPACQTPPNTYLNGGTAYESNNVCFYGLNSTGNSSTTIYAYIYPEVQNAGNSN